MFVLGAGLIVAVGLVMRPEGSDDSLVVEENADETGMTSQEREELMRLIGYVQQ